MQTEVFGFLRSLDFHDTKTIRHTYGYSMLDAKTTQLLTAIYGSVPEVLGSGLLELFRAADDKAAKSEAAGEPERAGKSDQADLWNEQDVVLITYADQIRSGELSPLRAQNEWLLDQLLDEVISTVHLLPFCPYTSDDGFSVVDYLAVDPDVGTWTDISNLGDGFSLMFDLVLNHASQKHAWFEAFLAGDPDYADFFIDVDPSIDLSDVVRPRSLPLLTPFDTESGTRHIWTTFSPDQVDLNYANPKVMLAMLETLVQYARRGSRIVRLDAIAFLWKEIGTNCLHLPQTHAAVKLMRHVLDRVVPGSIILTETNVPHAENISYLGDGTDEAHMVYQFSLPPLLLDAIHNNDTSVIRDWLASLKPPSEQTTFFNFTASHDGVGVRPLEGIVSAERVQKLVDVVKQHGGRVSMRSQPDGSESPYELNIAYIDAVANKEDVSEAEHARRFLATQAVMLSIQGMPAIYFHSLVGTPNDQAGVEESGQNRRINRHKYDRAELDSALWEAHSLQRRVFDGYRRLLEVRCQLKAFHPRASQTVIDLPGDGLLGFTRESTDGQKIVVLANLSMQPRKVPASAVDVTLRYDELAEQRLFADDDIPMRPFQVRWLSSD